MELKDKIKALLIFAQNDMLRMTENAKLQKQSEQVIGNKYNAGFHGGNVQAFDYACKHLTNILEVLECNEQSYEVSSVKCSICENEWVAVRPLGTEKLECKNCGHNTYFENLGV